jgi:hypothetical protein
MQGGAARLDGAVAGDAQLADRFDDPAVDLDHRDLAAAQIAH